MPGVPKAPDFARAAAYDPLMDRSSPDPADLVELRRCANEFQAGIIHAILEDAGIRSTVGTTEKTLPGVFGLSGFREAVVMVRAEDLDRARATLDARREESVDLDWSEINVGEPADPLARRIAEGERERTGWWRGGWKASVVLIVIAMVMMPFSADIAWVIALAAIIAGAGSGGSWMISRMKRTGATSPGPEVGGPIEPGAKPS